GPSLAGVLGGAAGEVQGYNFSPALKNSGVVCNEEALHKYVLAPQAFIPKNKMAFPGLRNESERANVIAYLASVSGAPSQAPVQQAQQAPQQQSQPPAPPSAAPHAARPTPSPAQAQQPETGTFDSVGYIPDIRLTLRSGIAEGRMVYIGVGGTIDGMVNPILSAAEGQIVQIT